MHMSGLDADRGQTCLDQARVKPRRQWTSLQTDSTKGAPEVKQVSRNHSRIALQSGAVLDLTDFIKNAEGSLFDRDVKANKVLHGSGSRLTSDRHHAAAAAARRVPEYPI